MYPLWPMRPVSIHKEHGSTSALDAFVPGSREHSVENDDTYVTMESICQNIFFLRPLIYILIKTYAKNKQYILCALTISNAKSYRTYVRNYPLAYIQLR